MATGTQKQIPPTVIPNTQLPTTSPIKKDPLVELLAKPMKCTYIKGHGKPCAVGAVLGYDRCRKHLRPGRPRLSLLSLALSEAPTLTSLIDYVGEHGDYFNMEQDLIAQRALLARFVASHQEQLEKGDGEVIDFIFQCIEDIGKTIERIDGKKYTLTLAGANILVQQWLSILQLHLATQPELLKAVAQDISQLKLPAGSLAR